MLSDRATLEAFRRGDRATLAAVYQRYLPTISRLARRGFTFQSEGKPVRFTGFDQDYEHHDVIQETFVRAFSERARQGYNGLNPYEGYLVGIARNVVVDLFRSRASRLRAFEGVFAEGNTTREGERVRPEEALDHHRLVAFVSAFVEALPKKERRVVELRYREGLTQEDVARRLKIGRTSVRTLDRRVRGRLQRALLKQGLVSRDAKASGSAILAGVLC